MADNIAKKAVERTSRALLGKVFPGFGKVAGEAAGAIFSAVVRTGSALVTDIAASMDGDATSRKGRQEKVSGWLARYDFASPVRDSSFRSGGCLVVAHTKGEAVSQPLPLMATSSFLLKRKGFRFSLVLNAHPITHNA